MIRFTGFPPVSLALAVLIAADDLPAAAQARRHSVRHERKVMVPMRDGVRLATDLYLPAGSGKFPVVLSRTPYGRDGWSALADSLAARGYVGVWQDTRGRFDSEGEWVPFVHESDDGFDAIQWAATRPWSNGRVFMLGGSYGAMVQWLAAQRRNPHLAGLISIVAPGDFYQDFFWEGGAFAFGASALWTTFTDGKKLVEIAGLPWDGALRRLPLIEAVKAVGHDPPAFRQWLSHPTNDAFWQALRFDDDFAAFDFPVLHVGGWFDIFQKGTFENFRRMTTRAALGGRSRQHLVVGPWGHQGTDQPKVGDVDFGPGSVLHFEPLVSRWLDHYGSGSKETEGSASPLPPVRLFVMGENQWREYPSWAFRALGRSSISSAAMAGRTA